MLDPVVSLRQRVRLPPGGAVRLSFATGMASDRETAEALARKYHNFSATGRTFLLAASHAESGLRHLGISADEAVLFERLASRVLGTDGSLRASGDAMASNELGQAGLWPHAISGDLPILLVRVVGDLGVPLVRQVLQAQEYWRLKGLSADVVIVNEHPASYLDQMQEQLTAVLADGPWSAWQHRPGGRICCGPTVWGGLNVSCSKRWRAQFCAVTAATSALQLDRPKAVQSPRDPPRANLYRRNAAFATPADGRAPR